MRGGFRAWMTGAAILVVGLTVASMLLYALPVAGGRLEGYDLDRATARAAQTADAIAESEGRDLERSLALAADPDEREAVFVDREGRVVASAGPRLLEEDPAVLGEAAAGGRMFREAGGLDVAVVPAFYEGELQGGVVIASRGTEGGVFGFFLRSSVEAAMLASVLGGGLVLLLASLLSVRVERLASGARAIARGDLSHRIEPGFGDELGQLARAFNSMASKLQASFSLLEERVEARTAELEKERARLEAVLRQMPSGVIIAEAPSGRVVLGNDRVERILRRPFLPAASVEQYGRYGGFHPEDGRPYKPEERPLARSVRGGEVVKEEEIDLLRGDGTRGTMLVSSSPIRDGEGRVVAGVSIFDDVTERKRAEEVLQDSEERFRATFEQAAVGMAYDAHDGTMLRANKKLGDILGYAPAELVGRKFRDFTHPDDVEENLGHVRRLLKGEVEFFSMEKRCIRKDGSVVWVNVTGSLAQESPEGPNSFIAVIEDITERKRSEEEIRRLNEGLERRVEERTAELEKERRTLDVVLTNLSEGVMTVDAGGGIIFANPAARAMLGPSLAGGGWPQTVPDPWAEFDLPLAVARVSEGCEGIVARVGGARTPLLEVRLEPLPTGGAEGAQGGVLVVAQDLSEGRRLEERQQRFLADAAHELKTPLTAILGAAELLEEDDEMDPEVRRRFLGRIHSEARRMRRLSETMLKLARTGADLREPRLRPVEMDFLKEVAERAEPLVERAGLELELVVEDRGGLVLVDPEWLEQALLILVSNAAKHSGRGGRVWLRVDGGTFEVEDEGEGISEEDLPYVFERHYRGEGGSSGGGFGLGLPICKELVERMGGEISVESVEGVGTTARIRLPEVGPDE